MSRCQLSPRIQRAYRTIEAEGKDLVLSTVSENFLFFPEGLSQTTNPSPVLFSVPDIAHEFNSYFFLKLIPFTPIQAWTVKGQRDMPPRGGVSGRGSRDWPVRHQKTKFPVSSAQTREM